MVAVALERRTPMIDLTTIDDLDRALAASERHPVVLFKHSRSCAISAIAQCSLKSLDEDDDPDVYRIVVQSARGLSDEVARRFGVRHESPQAFVVHDGALVWNASHGAVRAAAVREEAARARENTDTAQ